MEITTEIESSEISDAELKQSNNCSDYFFIAASIGCIIKYDNKITYFTLQTAEFYHNNDYSLPSNKVSIYRDSCDDNLILMICEEGSGSLEDEKTVDWINDECETSYSMSEMQALRQALNELEIDAQIIVTEAEQEAEQELEDDTTIYVLQSYLETDKETGQRRQCGYPTLYKFYTDDEADEYVENHTDSAIVSKEQAHTTFADNLKHQASF